MVTLTRQCIRQQERRIVDERAPALPLSMLLVLVFLIICVWGGDAEPAKGPDAFCLDLEHSGFCSRPTRRALATKPEPTNVRAERIDGYEGLVTGVSAM